MGLLIINKKEARFNFIEKIKKGSIFVVLTDTIYGLSCVFDNFDSLNRIKKIKRIENHRPFIILVSDFFMLKKYFNVSVSQEKLLKKIWGKNERPTSVILDAKDYICNQLKLDKKIGVAVRLPKRNFLIKIIKLLGKPLVSTSCNITGEKFLNNIKDIGCFFKTNIDQPDIILKLEGERPGKRPSKLIDLRDFKNIKIIRD
ncbi:hypothetical protein CVU82_02145 [Candidatus Falkowbacteria bacterium HGW-Falkowbacteria-1]|jgi:L-threonylcarbamoyladenylate synthase|uniref:L-threonylcarbamoyladenylate synthase n=1 Tax=Candidatus Falkowbacteria bacterium HGW-Falkowbacteria-1 TaxID=2013768 RepID=A0A2N2E9J2_9BACT|nr:MAG: hypothetical protein CVU82_02145 [Candidatus Falkowbacteria bacterium HGW-Falkowbacteria-1]